MNVIVAVIGWIIVAEGLLGIARPHLLLDAVHSWSADVQPRVIGVIAFVAGIVIALVGANRLASMVERVSGQPNWVIQLMYALATVLGALLVFSGSAKKKGV
jgi:hypothetical protein